MDATLDMDHSQRSGELDLRGLGAAIARKRLWIILPTCVAIALMAVFVSVVKPRYTAAAQVLLENQENFLTRPERNEISSDTNSLVDPEAVGSQVQLVSSRDLARRVIQALHLEGNEEFDPSVRAMGALTRVMVLLGVVRDPTQASPEERILATFQEHLTVFSPTKTRVLTIEFQSRDADLAARAANEIATTYLALQSDAKRERAKAAAASLETLIADLRIKVSQADAQVEDFRASSGLLAGTNNMTISGQQLAEMNSELSRARTSQADAQAKATLIRDMIKQNRISEVPDVANNDLVRRIGEQRVTLKSQLALESRTLLPGHPRIKELNAQIADIESELRAAADRTARALENDAKIAAARVANLEAAMSQQKKVATLANTDEVHLRALERVSQSYKDQLESSTTKYQEALARESSLSTPADARIFSRASVPQEPSFPKKGPYLIFAALAAFVLSFGGVVASEVMVERTQEIASVPAAAPAAPAAPIQPVDREPFFSRLAAFGQSAAASREAAETSAPSDVDSAPPQAEATAGLAEKMAALSLGGRALRVVMTKPAADTNTAEDLVFARELSAQGRAILVDIESGSGLLEDLVAEQGQRAADMAGLAELLAGQASFAEVIHRDPVSRLHFIPAGSAGAAEFHNLDLVLDALSETYDFILLNVAPASSSAMVKALAPYADVIVFAGAGAGEVDRALHDDLIDAGARHILYASDAGLHPAQDVA